MKTTTIFIVATAIPGLVPDYEQHVGRYIQSFDLDKDKEFGLLGLRTCSSYDDALKFEDLVEASEFWKQQSKTVPLRGDGKPNRPLTLFTVEIRSWPSKVSRGDKPTES